MENKRQNMIELWRFIAAILIMTHHLFAIGVEQIYPFRYASVYVEFFFILSGYFTMKHYANVKMFSINEKIRNSFLYTYKKYKSFFPYIVIMVISVYLIKYFDLLKNDIRGFIAQIPNAFTEILLLSSITEIREAGNLWFLSAMIIVFPLFCILCQCKYRYILYLISFYIFIFYYSIFGVESITHFPFNLFRTIASMMGGIWAYALSQYLKRKEFGLRGKFILTCIEQGSLILALLSCFYNLQISYLYLFAFIIGIAIMTSQKSYTDNIKSKLFVVLGKLSLPIFICHGIIMKFVNFKLQNINIKEKVFVYYVLSISISIVVYILIEGIKKRHVNTGELRSRQGK